MAVDRLYNAFWDESFWFPPNRTHCWNDLVNEPGSDIYMPDIKHLHWSIVLGVLLIGVRYLIEILIVVPIAIRLGVSDKRRPAVVPNEHLEKAYRYKRQRNKDTIMSLLKQTDLTERQIENWFRKRKNMDAPTSMAKFRECSWHLVFYTSFFVYAVVYLWQKPYAWKTTECWRDWPKQHITRDMFWHYMVELSFYWGLVFTLFTDTKRKDFKEMIIHHFATIVLMNFSWILNFVRVGTMVLTVHDAADTWLALAKMSKYAKNKVATDVFFGIFLVVWVVTRLILYPLIVLYGSTLDPFTMGIMDTSFGAHQFFSFFLYLLLLLHILWTYMIFRILYRKLSKGTAEDVRSDSDVDSFNEQNKISENESISNGELKVTNGHMKSELKVRNGTNAHVNCSLTETNGHAGGDCQLKVRNGTNGHLNCQLKPQNDTNGNVTEYK